jgi:hypothetical protein
MIKTQKEEGKTMKLLKSRRLMLILISFALIFAFGVMTSVAQEKVKIKDKRYWVNIKSEVMKVDDTEGHVIMTGESKGIDVGSGAITISKGGFDLVKGNGTHWSYSKTMGPDGDTFTKAEGKVTTALSPAGKPIMTMEGTWSMIRGTGKWEGFQGSGTFKVKVIGEGVSVMDWEGELTKK